VRPQAGQNSPLLSHSDIHGDITLYP
jgi:hypothetical protein